jgi:hypothetical protein
MLLLMETGGHPIVELHFYHDAARGALFLSGVVPLYALGGIVPCSKVAILVPIPLI